MMTGDERLELEQLRRELEQLRRSVRALAGAGAPLAAILQAVEAAYDAAAAEAGQLEHAAAALRAAGFREYYCDGCTLSFCSVWSGVCPHCGTQALPVIMS